MNTRLTRELPGSGGTLSAERIEDFVVDEVLAYEASGEGEHLFLRIEKRGLTTDEAVRRLGLRSAGIAGMKDRHAIATQWLSIPLPLKDPIPTFPEASDLRVLEVARHRHKLRRGHQRLNRFAITIRDVPPGGIERAVTILERLRATGVPNRFGPQRFGKDGDNAERALAMIRREAPRPRSRRLEDLLISALQSKVYNRILDARIERGLFLRALAGDVMVKHETGGMFVVEAAAAETLRVERLEISPTGLLPGNKAKLATGEAGELEALAIRDEGLTERDVGRMSVGTRRALRYPLDTGARIEPVEADAYRLTVALPSGAFATVLLDELVKPENGPFDRSE
jgi:tRNA pseudouridine13 synthase